MSEEDYLLEKIDLAKKIANDCAEFLNKVGHDSLSIDGGTTQSTITVDKKGKVCYVLSCR